MILKSARKAALGNTSKGGSAPKRAGQKRKVNTRGEPRAKGTNEKTS